jgi:hypothetical protein
MDANSNAVADRPAHEEDPKDVAKGSEDLLKQWLDLALTGPRTATWPMRKALGATQRLAHAPYDLAHGFVNSAVLVNVDVDVDIASRPTT